MDEATNEYGAPSRRTFLKAAASGIALISISPLAAHATPKETQEKIEQILSGKSAQESKVNMTMSDIAENGGAVPLNVHVDSPMIEGDHVKVLHILADDNPLPEVASYYLSPLNGRAEVSLRIRLNKTQKVVALAEMSNGDFHIARKEIKVTIGGCL